MKSTDEPEELIKRDVYRLGVFSKNSINTYHMNNIVSFMTTGGNIEAFITVRGWISFFIKMFKFGLPVCRWQITKLLSCLDKMLNFSHMHLTNSKQSQDVSYQAYPALPFQICDDTIKPIKTASTSINSVSSSAPLTLSPSEAVQ